MVLIDTWWNVNTYSIIKLGCSDWVLIDTWWNVNYAAGNVSIVKAPCFNRYMVECEFLSFEALDRFYSF